MAYTEEYLLSRIKEHCIDNHLSKWTITKPTWNGYTKRMKKDPEFASKVEESIALADQHFEKMALDNLLNKDFNTRLWQMLTKNKPFTKDHATLELEQRIEALEEAHNEKS